MIQTPFINIVPSLLAVTTAKLTFLSESSILVSDSFFCFLPNFFRHVILEGTLLVVLAASKILSYSRTPTTVDFQCFPSVLERVSETYVIKGYD